MEVTFEYRSKIIIKGVVKGCPACVKPSKGVVKKVGLKAGLS